MGSIINTIKKSTELVGPYEKQFIHPFGDNEYGIISNSKDRGFTKFFSGHCQCFGVDADENIFSWGLNDYGQLGKGTVDDYSEKSNYNDEEFIDNYSWINHQSSPLFKISVTKISCGNGFSAILTKEKKVFTFGLGNDGQLGYEIKFSESYIVNNVQKCQLTPKKIDYFDQNNITIIDIECGKNFLLAIDHFYRVYGCGDNTLGQLALSKEYKNLHSPKVIESIDFKIVKLKCGWSSAIALTGTGDVYVWGNALKEYNSSIENLYIPHQVKSIGKTVDIAHGFNHFVTLSHLPNQSDYNVYTWGANEYNQLGFESEEDYCIEPRMVDLLSFAGIKTAVYAGSYHTIIQYKNKTFVTFGHNYNKEIGDYNDEKISRPVLFNHTFDTYQQNIRVECGNGFTIMVTQQKEDDYEEVKTNVKSKGSKVNIDGKYDQLIV